jgi:peroxiredoxin
MRQLAAGTQAPEFELNDTNGQRYRLSTALESGPVVLVFFKVSCPTCQFMFPHIQRIFASVGKDRQAQLWGVSQDDAVDTLRFARHYGVTFAMLIDSYPYDVSNAYGIVSVPTVFLIERDGTISYSDNGFSKASLNRIAGFEMYQAGDGLPATRPG